MPSFLPAHSMNAQGLSDHSPIGFTVSAKSPLPPRSRPIPSFITKHPYFRQSLELYEAEHNITYGTLLRAAEGNPFLAIHNYNNIIRQTAASTLNFLMELGDTGFFTRCLVHIHITMCFFSIRSLLLNF